MVFTNHVNGNYKLKSPIVQVNIGEKYGIYKIKL